MVFWICNGFDGCFNLQGLLLVRAISAQGLKPGECLDAKVLRAGRLVKTQLLRCLNESPSFSGHLSELIFVL